MVAKATNGQGTQIKTAPSYPQLKLDTLAEINELALALKRGGLLPKDVTREEQLVVRILAGREVGLKPIQSINWITVIPNTGRATIWGDAALALVRGSGLLVSFDEKIENEDEDKSQWVAYCSAKRVGVENPVERKFSMKEAHEAGLLEKKSPWQTYPKRMLQMRARAYVLRDLFTDVLAGLGIAEEEQDLELSNPTIGNASRLLGGGSSEGKVSGIPLGPQPEILEPTKAPVEEVATPKAESELQPITERTLEELSNYRLNWLRHLGINTADAEAVRTAWRGLLGEMFGVESAKTLTEEQGQKLLVEIKKPWEKEVEAIFPEAVKS